MLLKAGTNINKMTNTPYWIELAQKMQSIAQNGLTYAQGKYDIERYEQLRQLSIDMLEHYTGEPNDIIKQIFASDSGYRTPKIDVRGVVFHENKILLVQELLDMKWSLPGGWAEVGLSPFENTKKEVLEEAGIKVTPIRILALLDKRKHAHPPDINHSYKIFVLCQWDSGELKAGMETNDAAFFSRDAIPETSMERIIPEQIATMFEFLDNPEKTVYCD